MKGMVGLARRLNSYLELRNRALLEQQMGLGEFTWIQMVAYHAWLAYPVERFALAQEDEPRVVQDRVVPQIREMIRRHIAAGDTESRLDAWRRELQALEADPERVPFADGVPAEIAASLAPFREELERLYCPATCELDLTITTHEGIGFEHI